MNTNQLPSCTCGKRRWEGGGGSFSSYLQQHSYKCGACERPSIFLSNGGGNTFIVPTAKDFPESIDRWLNDSLLVAWRDVSGKKDKAREVFEKAQWDNLCDKLDLPRGTTIDKAPEEKREQMKIFFEEVYTLEDYRRPAGFEKPIIPPHVPEGIEAYILLEGNTTRAIWEKVSREESLRQVVPPDPIRVRHDVYFTEVFAEFRKKTGLELQIEHVANEYGGSTKNQPWFRFSLGKNTIVVGPRKRVVSIKIEAPEGFHTKKLRTAAAKVDTTYEADGGWKSKVESARKIEVHAWDKEQLLEFLSLIAEESLGVGA